MEQRNTKFRLIIAFLFALIVLFATAYLQITLKFNTYLALAICIVAACIFAKLVVGNS